MAEDWSEGGLVAEEWPEGGLIVDNIYFKRLEGGQKVAH